MPAACSPPSPSQRTQRPLAHSGHSTYKLDVLQVRDCKPVCIGGDPRMCSVSLQCFPERDGIELVLFISDAFGGCKVFEFHMKIRFPLLFKPPEIWCPWAGFPWGGEKLSKCSAVCIIFSFSSLFSIFYIFFFSCLTDIKQDCDHLKVPHPPLGGVARLPACSQERPPPHPGSIRSSTSRTA